MVLGDIGGHYALRVVYNGELKPKMITKTTNTYIMIKEFFGLCFTLRPEFAIPQHTNPYGWRYYIYKGILKYSLGRF